MKSNYSLRIDDLLSGPPTGPPVLPDLASAWHRMADAVGGSEHRKVLTWALRGTPVGRALRMLRALSEACGQSETAQDAAAVGLDLPQACRALAMIREAEAGRYDRRRLTHDITAPLWFVRTDAYGLAVYGGIRGWCHVPIALQMRSLAVHADIREADEHEINPALDAVAERAQQAAIEHARQEVGRELWSVLEIDAATAAGWVTRWKI